MKTIRSPFPIQVSNSNKASGSWAGLLFAIFLVGCNSYQKHLNEAVSLGNGNTETGNIVNSDSVQLRLQKLDGSLMTIQWSDIANVSSIKRQSLAISMNGGIFYSPYHSVFKNENYDPTVAGTAIRVGMLKYGKRYRYVNLAFLPTEPYNIFKTGVGFQRYFGRDYLAKWNLHAGSEFNLMHIKYNNVPQFCIEPYLGGELKWTEQVRFNSKLAFVYCPLGKNSRLGTNLMVGINYLFANIEKRQATFLQNRKL